MAKIRVSDLAVKMGLSNQDLVFKLKSIGARIEGDDAEIDADVIQAILTGKQLHQPHEVLLRDGETAAPTRRKPPRRLPNAPQRPRRRRSIVQRVEPRIRTLPTPAKPAEPQAPPAPSAPAELAAQEAAVDAAATTTAGAGEKAVAQPETSATAGPARAVAREDARPQKPPKDAKRPTAQRESEQDLRAYRGSVQDIETEQERLEMEATVSSRGRRRAERKEQQGEVVASDLLAFKGDRPQEPIALSEGMTLRVFAERLGVRAKDLIQKLMNDGTTARINQVIEPELCQRLAEELGVETVLVSFEEEVQREEESKHVAEGNNLLPRAPIVTIMGHVDHGKTSILDRIRSSNIVAGEAGGITQHIAAYRVTVNDCPIVFLDTPGHEAFTKLRARGAQVTDIVIMVVAADDGVMAQTSEAIDHAKAAGVPLVVAINKIDKANAKPDKVKQDLADHGVMVEDWGGEVVSVPVSALKDEGIDTLLEMVLLTADMLDLKADPSVAGQGVVLEARKEKGRGNVATVLVRSGTLRQGDVCVVGATWGKIRAMTDDRGERITESGPATPVELTGFGELPEAGDTLQVVDHESKARSIAAFRQQEERQKKLAPSHGTLSLEQLFESIEEGSVEELAIVLKADVKGSVEVLKDTLEDLSTDKVRVKILLTGVGGISTNDVLFAAASRAIVLGFNVRPEQAAAALALKEGVDIHTYTVIYDILDELEKAMTGLLKPTIKEVELGRAEVRETFKVPRIGTIAGCHVVEGRIPRSALARLLRDNVVVYEGKITSLRRFKDDAAEVRSGFDCGIGLERFQDVKPGDYIEVYEHQEVAATL